MTTDCSKNSTPWIMDNFENPRDEPIEELKIKYTLGNSSYDDLIPALDQKWCNKEYVFALYLPPPSKNNDGEFTMGLKEDWLERMSIFVEDIYYLLELDYHRFWSQVVYSSSSLSGLSSFLQYAPPYYARDTILQDKQILKTFKAIQEPVFLLLLRLTCSKESEKAWMRSKTLGSILYDKFVISLPQLMEICLIYSSDNFKEVSELVNRVIDIQPKYMSDIDKSTLFICEVLSKIENQIHSSASRLDGGPSLSSTEVGRLIHLLLDIGFSLATFLEVCPRAGLMFHDQQIEHRIASFYGNTFPELQKHLDDQRNRGENDGEWFTNYQFKLNLSRHQLVCAAHGCLTSYLAAILENRDKLSEQELKNKVDNYLNTLSDCLTDHLFVRDFNSAFPVEKELNILTEIYNNIDSVKCNNILESIHSLYDKPTKSQKVSTTRASVVTVPSEDLSTQASQVSEESRRKKVTGVELESFITEVQDILPHLGGGFVEKCLEFYNFSSSDVINAVLENTLPDSLSTLDPEMPFIPPEETKDCNQVPERINVFDNDEFDIMTQDNVDTSRIHKGKRQDSHKNLIQMLDDKSYVNQLRDKYTELSLVECLENVGDYEDEYDDTYDDVDVAVGNEGETEAEERRPFVIPRVLQQYKKSSEGPPECVDGDYEDEENSGEPKADLFIENPAVVRARAEQRRLELRGRSSGRSRAAFSHRDVVGKPKGQGQDKDVVISRDVKNTSKSTHGNHNRRSMAAKKRRQGMFPT